jgi:fatty-acyl-CoA synthase
MTVSRAELSPVAFLERTATLFPERTAVVAGGRRLTYAELRARARRLASALSRRGLAAGERVAVVHPNGPAPLEAHFGVPGARGVLVAVNVRLTPEEIGAILADAGARVVILDRELARVAAHVPAGTDVVWSDDTGRADDPYEQLLDSGSPEGRLAGPAAEDDPIALSYTSGTTGRPKGAVYTHRGAYLTSLGNALDLGLTGESAYLWTLPMFHCDGWCFPWAVTAVGARHVCLRRPDPAAVWALLEAERITHYCCAPTVQIDVVNHAEARPLARPVRVAMGGAPPSPTLIARMQELGFDPHHLYGLTETYGPHTSCAWHGDWDALGFDERARLRARQGQVILAGEELEVLGADDRPVPHDGRAMGELVLRGNTVATGYHDQPEQTAQAFRDGWLRTGDLAVVHPDGYVELRDRAKDIVISGGENISTIEVEQAIAKHPAVLECAVVAVPDERWGERPKAFVALKEGAEATERELVAFAREHLAHFKCPDTVEFGPLPKTSTGKVQKVVLREREWAGREKRIS